MTQNVIMNYHFGISSIGLSINRQVLFLPRIESVYYAMKNIRNNDLRSHA